MFGRKKQEEVKELKFVIEEIKREQAELKKNHKEQTVLIKELREELSGYKDQLDDLCRDNLRQLKRHSEAIEDMLDERKTQETMARQYEQKVKEDSGREEALLSLICRYQEELSLIEGKLAGKDVIPVDGWAGQFALFRKSLAGELKQCVIEETGTKGENADYRYHEILDVVDTEDEKLDNTVAHIYRPGCIYYGKVVRKAQVAVYKLRRE